MGSPPAGENMLINTRLCFLVYGSFFPPRDVFLSLYKLINILRPARGFANAICTCVCNALRASLLGTGQEPDDCVEDVRQASAEETSGRRHAEPRAGQGHTLAGVRTSLFAKPVQSSCDGIFLVSQSEVFYPPNSVCRGLFGVVSKSNVGPCLWSDTGLQSVSVAIVGGSSACAGCPYACIELNDRLCAYQRYSYSFFFKTA